jgi:hypothetical protein
MKVRAWRGRMKREDDEGGKGKVSWEHSPIYREA